MPKKAVMQSDAIEAALLGSILIKPDNIYAVRSFLHDEHFFYLRNGQIYAALCAIDSRDDDIDEVTVAQELQARGQFEDVGGRDYLHYLADNVPNITHAVSYAKTICRAADWRRLAGKLDECKRIVDVADVPFKQVLDLLYDTLDELSQFDDGLGLIPFSEAVDEAMDEWLGWCGDPQTIRGFRTGIAALDNMVGGFMPGRVSSLILPTSGGKSTFIRQISLALVNQAPGLIVPTEMTHKAFIHSTITQCLGLHSHTLERGEPDGDERITREYQRLMAQQAHFLSSARPSIHDIETAARRLRRRYGDRPLWMLVDSGSNVHAPKVSKIFDVTKEVIGTLARIAVDYHYHIWVTWQINRESYGHEGAAITSGRGGGDIENDSDYVFTIDRPDYKQRTGLTKGDKPIDFNEPVKADLRVLKSRHNPIAGKVVPLLLYLGRGYYPADEDIDEAPDVRGNGRPVAPVAAGGWVKDGDR